MYVLNFKKVHWWTTYGRVLLAVACLIAKELSLARSLLLARSIRCGKIHVLLRYLENLGINRIIDCLFCLSPVFPSSIPETIQFRDSLL